MSWRPWRLGDRVVEWGSNQEALVFLILILPICPRDSLVASQAKGLLKWHAFRWQGPQGSSRSHYVLLILQWIKYRRLNYESGYCTCREFEFLHVLKLQQSCSMQAEPSSLRLVDDRGFARLTSDIFFAGSKLIQRET